MRTGITITLSQDVADGGEVAAVEGVLLEYLKAAIDEFPGVVIEEPAVYKNGQDGQYQLMRDEEGQDQYVEVRVRARVG